MVVWSKPHRELLESRYTLERQPGTPTSLDIRLAQEDIWVLENLAKVIRKTNEGAEDVIAAPIKRIDSLDIAQWAINDAVKESPKIVVADSRQTRRVVGAWGVAWRGAAGPPPGGDAAAPTDPAEKDKLHDEGLLNGRYIGDTGLPLAAADPAPYAEFKLMFVRLKVVIDQRKIPDLLRNCGNAADSDRGRAGHDARAVGFGRRGRRKQRRCRAWRTRSRGLGGGSPRRLGGGGGQPQNQSQSAGGANKGDDIEANPSDVTVEVCGLVQLFNPPDDPAETDDSKRNLGKGGAADPGKRPAGVPAAAVIEPRGGRSLGEAEVEAWAGLRRN